MAATGRQLARAPPSFSLWEVRRDGCKRCVRLCVAAFAIRALERRAAMPLGRRTDYGDARYAGVEVDVTADVELDLKVRPSRCIIARIAAVLTRRRPRRPLKLAASIS